MVQTKRHRGHILSEAGKRKLQVKLTQLESQQGYRFTPQILAHKTQLIDSQGLHSATVKKILEQQTGVDRRSIEIIFQTLEIEPDHCDYQPLGQTRLLPQAVSPNDDFPKTRPPRSPEFPGGPVPLDSPYYIPHGQLQRQAIDEISQPGGLICIKAPRRMGKSSFALRLQHRATALGYRVLQIDLKQADEAVFSSIDRFLRWVCTVLSYQLDLPPILNDYWNADVGSKVSCTIYLQQVLLKAVESPLVLLFKDVDRIFEYPVISGEFLPLLRSWHEEAKSHAGLQKLRFVLTYSTEIYVPLNLNQSPFNVGLPINLPKLAADDVRALGQVYNLGGDVVVPLMELVGGHPYLIQLAFYHLWSGQCRLQDLLQRATTGVYANHLTRCLAYLQDQSALAAAFQQVIDADGGIRLALPIAKKLEGLGLIEFDQFCQARSSCQLYQQFFAAHFRLNSQP